MQQQLKISRVHAIARDPPTNLLQTFSSVSTGDDDILLALNY